MSSGPLEAVARLKRDFPAAALSLDIVADWIRQDHLDGDWGRCPEVVTAICRALGSVAQPLRDRSAALRRAGVPYDEPRWAELYLDACHERRLSRLAPHKA